MRRDSTSLWASLLSFTAVLGVGLSLAPGCGSDDDKKDGGVDDLFQKNANGGPCTGLACQVDACGGTGSTTTTVSGTVYAPNGTLPLYNVVVYVPNAPLDPLPEGASCDRCGNVSGDPITTTLSDVNGRFTLKNVPTGANIPLVIQVGKWRRQITIPEVKKCADTPLDKSLTRLPKNQSEGHIPKIAATTGRCDHLACLLPKLGLDASEYSAPGGSGRLNIFRGAAHKGPHDAAPVPAPAPNGSPDATALWNSVDTLKAYDMVLLSCECGEHEEMKSPAAKSALYDFAKLGGRVFSSHYHYTWFQNSPAPEVRGVAQWAGDGKAPGGDVPPFFVDDSFPKGKALSEWLSNVGASPQKGVIPINQARSDVIGVSKPQSTRWVYNKPFILPETTKYLSFNAPVDKSWDQQCGKVVFGDMHVTQTDLNDKQNGTTLPDDGFPGTCPSELTPEEKALIFFFFDLSSCVQKEDDTPVAPPPK
ncbi:MAG: carboxypeptidase regulatory-like domain-containing protein [Polyangiaceae bacterium]